MGASTKHTLEELSLCGIILLTWGGWGRLCFPKSGLHLNYVLFLEFWLVIISLWDSKTAWVRCCIVFDWNKGNNHRVHYAFEYFVFISWSCSSLRGFLPNWIEICKVSCNSLTLLVNLGLKTLTWTLSLGCAESWAVTPLCDSGTVLSVQVGEGLSTLYTLSRPLGPAGCPEHVHF